MEDNKNKSEVQAQETVQVSYKEKNRESSLARHWMCCPDSAVSIFWNQQ